MKAVTRQEVEAAVSKALKQAGFTFSGGIATYKLNREFLGWIGINVGNHPEFIRLNVSVGVHCLPVMQAFADSLGLKYRKGKSATYSEHLNTVVAARHDYIISDNASMIGEVNKLVETLTLEAKPFIESLGTFSAMEEKIRPLIYQFGGNPELYALVLLQSGKISQFEDFSEYWLTQCQDEQAIRWRDFLSSVKK
jgi:hypothetical protein